ncbi:MAG: hypothetical protein IJV70_03850 [Clostridia bacterium]|nr:hypothetical protein [Clostridia bacterium]
MPTTKSRRENWGSVWVTEADNVYFENNAIQNSNKAYEDGLYVDTSTSKNVVVDGKVQ